MLISLTVIDVQNYFDTIFLPLLKRYRRSLAMHIKVMENTGEHTITPFIANLKLTRKDTVAATKLNSPSQMRRELNWDHNIR